jgi:hypothetical protein
MPAPAAAERAPVERRAPARAPSPEGRPVRGASKAAATQTPEPSEPAPASRRASGRTGTRVNIAVGDDGVQNLGPRPARAAAPAAAAAVAGGGAVAHGGDPQRAADDVTRLIREKLKSLRTL